MPEKPADQTPQAIIAAGNLTASDQAIQDPNSLDEATIELRKQRISQEIAPILNGRIGWVSSYIDYVDMPRDEAGEVEAWGSALRRSTHSATAAILENLDRRGVEVDVAVFIDQLMLEMAAKSLVPGYNYIVNGREVPQYRAMFGNQLVPIDSSGNFVMLDMDLFKKDEEGNYQPDIHQTPLLHSLVRRKHSNGITLTGQGIPLSDEQIEEADTFTCLKTILLGPEPFITERGAVNAYGLREGMVTTQWEESSRLPATEGDTYSLVFLGATKAWENQAKISGSTNREITNLNIVVNEALDDAAIQERVDYYTEQISDIRDASGIIIPVSIYKPKPRVADGRDPQYDLVGAF